MSSWPTTPDGTGGVCARNNLLDRFCLHKSCEIYRVLHPKEINGSRIVSFCRFRFVSLFCRSFVDKQLWQSGKGAGRTVTSERRGFKSRYRQASFRWFLCLSVARSNVCRQNLWARLNRDLMPDYVLKQWCDLLPCPSSDNDVNKCTAELTVVVAGPKQDWGIRPQRGRGQPREINNNLVNIGYSGGDSRRLVARSVRWSVVQIRNIVWPMESGIMPQVASAGIRCWQ